MGMKESSDVTQPPMLKETKMKNLIDRLNSDKLKEIKEKFKDLMILTERKLGLSCYGFPSVYYPGMVTHKMTKSELEKYAQITRLNISPDKLRDYFNAKQNELKQEYEIKHGPENLVKYANSLR